MATVFLRIEHTNKGDRFTERFLIDCSPRQEQMFRRANRKYADKDRTALFITLLCAITPGGETLAVRRAECNEALALLKDAAQLEENNLDIKLVTSISALVTTFFTSPYGLFKVTRSPTSILDGSSNFRITNVVINNNLDSSIFTNILAELLS
jgi:hypothetical protein